MTEVILEMRIRVPVDEESVGRCKDQLRRLVADLDMRPSFFTVERWLYEDLARSVPEAPAVPWAKDRDLTGKPRV